MAMAKDWAQSLWVDMLACRNTKEQEIIYKGDVARHAVLETNCIYKNASCRTLEGCDNSVYSPVIIKISDNLDVMKTMYK